jgi:hypothetical protein
MYSLPQWFFDGLSITLFRLIGEEWVLVPALRLKIAGFKKVKLVNDQNKAYRTLKVNLKGV